MDESEKVWLRDWVQRIVQRPVIEIPDGASGSDDLSADDRETVRELDRLFWEEMAAAGRMSGEILAAVRPVGGGMKLAALEQIVADLGVRGEDVMYVGDSITDAPPFAAVRRWGGVSLSFNGNGYALAAAEFAAASRRHAAHARAGARLRRRRPRGGRRHGAPSGPASTRRRGRRGATARRDRRRRRRCRPHRHSPRSASSTRRARGSPRRRRGPARTSAASPSPASADLPEWTSRGRSRPARTRGAGAGAVNAIAGGGTLITFPALTAVGVPPLNANMTNAVASSPAHSAGRWRNGATSTDSGGALAQMTLPAAGGGMVGALLLFATGAGLFTALVPWLILAATLLLAAEPWLRRSSARRLSAPARDAHEHPVGAVVCAFAASVYGGYFGAGFGIVMLALFSFVLPEPLARVNAVKQFVAVVANGTAAIVFATAGDVVWSAAAVMAAGALAGGSLGGRFAGRVRADVLRIVVVVIGLVVAGVYFVR